jgi:diguanylate cyclase (GGDEF)-like protein
LKVAAETDRRHALLVVDDDPNTVQLLRGWFGEDRFDIHAADDGASGLQAVREVRPEVILLDLKMPGELDGIAVARRLKSDAATRSIPIILLTACRSVDQKVEAFAAGADDYVTKPFEFEEIDARIQSMLRRRRMLVELESTIEDLQSENENLEQMLEIDEKTGLFNFRHFQRKLTEEWRRVERYGAPLSLVLFDLDNFKKLNDTLGHQAGDRALQEFATLLIGGARTTDMAARYGGEEFSVILPHTEGEMAARVAERIRRAVEEFVFLSDTDTPCRMTVSGGLATAPAAGLDSVDALVRAADRALYRAKDEGKNRIAPDASASRESAAGRSQETRRRQSS